MNRLHAPRTHPPKLFDGGGNEHPRRIARPSKGGRVSCCILQSIALSYKVSCYAILFVDEVELLHEVDEVLERVVQMCVGLLERGRGYCTAD